MSESADSRGDALLSGQRHSLIFLKNESCILIYQNRNSKKKRTYWFEAKYFLKINYSGVLNKRGMGRG